MSSTNPYQKKPEHAQQSHQELGNVDPAFVDRNASRSEVENRVLPNGHETQMLHSATDDSGKTMIAINQHQQLQFLCQMNGQHPPRDQQYPPSMYNNNSPWPYHPGFSQHAMQNSNPSPNPARYVHDASTGQSMLDGHGKPITIEHYLSSKPLRKDLSTRPGPGNRQLTYMSGDVVTRTLNEAFGHNGWSVETKSQSQIGSVEKDDRGRYQIHYKTTARITLAHSGVFREDVGFGDSIDKDFGTASSHAAKSSMTDAMKRAARHFGEKLGNSKCCVTRETETFLI
jgi:DNA recombination protein Rad52